jgi:hypothetical protein
MDVLAVVEEECVVEVVAAAARLALGRVVTAAPAAAAFA